MNHRRCYMTRIFGSYDVTVQSKLFWNETSKRKDFAIYVLFVPLNNECLL